ncbi:MAG: anthranilate synthase component I, partial [Limisphaerales bacterium]
MYSPTKDEFVRLAAKGNLIPVVRRILADFETPLSAYRKIRGQGESFLFESVEGGEHLGRYSFVGCNPRAAVVQRGDGVEIVENGRLTGTFRVRPDARGDDPAAVRDGLVVVERILGRYRSVDVPGLPRFTGGAVGYLGYEFIHDVEPVVPRPSRDELGTPVMYFFIADELLIFDRVTQTITALVNAHVQEGADPAAAYDNAVRQVERLVARLRQAIQSEPVTLPDEPPELPFASNTPPETFRENVRRAKEFITAGDIIQVVGSQRFSAPVKAAPIDIYR